jgi:hypothetical protein
MAEIEVDAPPLDYGNEVADEPDPAFGETDEVDFESPTAEEPEADDDGTDTDDEDDDEV